VLQYYGNFYEERVNGGIIMKTLKFKTGDSAKIINNVSSHLFPIDTIVRLEIKEGDNCYKAYSGDVYWWVTDEDLAPIGSVVREKSSVHTWVGINGDECSECGRYLSYIMDERSKYNPDFNISTLVACPFCGDRKDY
jgi:hypothetical protein